MREDSRRTADSGRGGVDSWEKMGMGRWKDGLSLA